jgi:hypothetical protein
MGTAETLQINNMIDDAGTPSPECLASHIARGTVCLPAPAGKRQKTDGMLKLRGELFGCTRGDEGETEREQSHVSSSFTVW